MAKNLRKIARLAGYEQLYSVLRCRLENGRILEAAWQTEPPGWAGRTVAGIIAHMHNVRLMWLKDAAKDAPSPPKLDGRVCTREQAKTSLAQAHSPAWH